MTRVLSVTSSRADAGILSAVWEAVDANPDLELHILVTGMHRGGAGEHRGLVPEGTVIHAAGTDLGGVAGKPAAEAMAEIASGTAAVCAQVEPDLMVVVGDRLDMLPAVFATLPFNLPVVHLHGGELSEGAIDDRVRHACTKLAHVHCTATVEAAQRVCRMGEEPWRIHVTGAPGLDTLLATQAMGPDEFAAALGLASTDGLRLVTVHPETNAADPQAVLDAVLDALDRSPAPTVITGPNSDPGGAEMRRRIAGFVAARNWAVFRDTLGALLYGNAMRHAAVMVGNSSSGIIEAGLFGLPVINVGERQGGRLHGPNVHDCPAQAAVVHALLVELSRDPGATECGTPYGDGRAGPRIAAVLAGLPGRQALLAKHFYGGGAVFEAPWGRGAGT